MERPAFAQRTCAVSPALHEPNAPVSWVAELSKLLAAAFDITRTDAMQAPAMSESTTAYSTAVAPSSRRRSFPSNWRMMAGRGASGIALSKALARSARRSHGVRNSASTTTLLPKSGGRRRGATTTIKIYPGPRLLCGICRTRPAPRPSLAAASRRGDSSQAWNELPQPQDLTALGLSNVKPRFSMPS